MKIKKILSMLCAIALLFSSFTLPVYANSAAPFWEGTDVSGLVVKEGDIPVIVENELLTFDLPTLPYARYNDVESFLAYDSKVTAKYTFYNPTDMTITATLLFPFGSRADYGHFLDAATELERYGVYVNGEKTEANIRHTAILSYDYFDTNAHIATLHDDFVQDDFYSPDLTVTKYSYEIVGQSFERAQFDILINEAGSERKFVMYDGNCGGYITNSKVFRVHASAKENETKTIHFYVFGEPLTTLPDASWYKNNYINETTKIDGGFKYLGVETTTLNDFIFAEYDEARGASKVDWYNACISEIKSNEESCDTTCLIRNFYLGGLMRWYEYKITFAPGERIENTVVVPMYPDIAAFNEPYEYRYTYLLSPASCWSDFGKLDIIINTPYEMSQCTLDGFEKTESGYKLSREGLPKDGNDYIDLHFTLLNDGNTPKYQPRFSSVRNFFKSIGSFFVRIFEAIAQFFTSIFG